MQLTLPVPLLHTPSSRLTGLSEQASVRRLSLVVATFVFQLLRQWDSSNSVFCLLKVAANVSTNQVSSKITEMFSLLIRVDK